MTQDELKQAVGQAAVEILLPNLEDKSIIGVGTGSTANHFIDALARHKGFFDGAVASSQATAERLKQHGIPVYDLNSVANLDYYVDGADEANRHLELIKGGGAALTRRTAFPSADATVTGGTALGAGHAGGATDLKTGYFVAAYKAKATAGADNVAFTIPEGGPRWCWETVEVFRA